MQTGGRRSPASWLQQSPWKGPPPPCPLSERQQPLPPHLPSAWRQQHRQPSLLRWPQAFRRLQLLPPPPGSSPSPPAASADGRPVQRPGRRALASASSLPLLLQWDVPPSASLRKGGSRCRARSRGGPGYPGRASRRRRSPRSASPASAGRRPPPHRPSAAPPPQLLPPPWWWQLAGSHPHPPRPGSGHSAAPWRAGQSASGQVRGWRAGTTCPRHLPPLGCPPDRPLHRSRSRAGRPG